MLDEFFHLWFRHESVKTDYALVAESPASVQVEPLPAGFPMAFSVDIKRIAIKKMGRIIVPAS